MYCSWNWTQSSRSLSCRLTYWLVQCRWERLPCRVLPLHSSTRLLPVNLLLHRPSSQTTSLLVCLTYLLTSLLSFIKFYDHLLVPQKQVHFVSGFITLQWAFLWDYGCACRPTVQTLKNATYSGKILDGCDLSSHISVRPPNNFVTDDVRDKIIFLSEAQFL